MKKIEILENLGKLSFPKNEFIVLFGASMVMQGIKEETNDIDLAVSSSLFEKIKDNCQLQKEILDKKIYLYDKEFELAPCYFDLSSATLIEGFYFQNAERILTLKKTFNRRKDQKDIKALDLYLCQKDNLRYEKELYNKGITLIAGVDEVGRGPLVGPVVSAAVILPVNYRLDGLTDSKKLSEKKRNYFNEIIKRDAVSYGIGVIYEKEIDEINIYEATKLAMKDAISKLNIKPEHILIDAMPLEIDIPSTSIIKGDIKSLSISAASVIAKVERDKMMYELDLQYPMYNFKNNKGYPTKDHISAINEYGILDSHRKTYSPVKDYLISRKNIDIR